MELWEGMPGTRTGDGLAQQAGGHSGQGTVQREIPSRTLKNSPVLPCSWLAEDSKDQAVAPEKQPEPVESSQRRKTYWSPVLSLLLTLTLEAEGVSEQDERGNSVDHFSPRGPGTTGRA